MAGRNAPKYAVCTISEAQTKVASMLIPLHQALKKAPLIHADNPALSSDNIPS
ncbi:hypothetical protein [Aliivibrio fischeri]|uniref:Uncharacterized protein n=1 Tax=Aliivibrio fischeri TaxID=668 RepID=A0A844P7C1_ALIFS|nr:hypothetical protein [Aliivibrio fischeri]MUK51027.1 hypothetical protein [Aliivibrio fischeri]